MRVALLIEGGHPYTPGGSPREAAWCDRLVRGLAGHSFEIYTLERHPAPTRPQDAPRTAPGPGGLPGNVRIADTAPLWGDLPATLRGLPDAHPPRPGRRARRRFAEHFADLVAGALATAATPPGAYPDRATERFAVGLHGLADLATEHRALPELLLAEDAVALLERLTRVGPGERGTAGPNGQAGVADLLVLAAHLERLLRPLSLDWYTPRDLAEAAPAGPHDARAPGAPAAVPTPAAGGRLAEADLCHATSAGVAALPGLLAKRRHGTPLLVTEVGVRLREHYLAPEPAGRARASTPVRALTAAFQRALAMETYARADLVLAGNRHARRWQERCGAPAERLRTLYPGMDATPFADVPDAAPDDSRCLVWVGTITPDKDLVGLLHAFARMRLAEPQARLRLVGAPAPTREATAYASQLRSLATQLFPDEAADARTAGESPVSFEEIGDPTAPTLADVHDSATVLVLSSAVEGFPRTLVEAMFSGRATVSTDVGAVCEVIGGTGLVVPPRNPRALADACVDLLRDPARRARLGAAARARALELFTVEQNVSAYRGIYLELMSRAPARRPAPDDPTGHHPFHLPAEAHVPGRWAGPRYGTPVAARPRPALRPRPEGARPSEPVGALGKGTTT